MRRNPAGEPTRRTDPRHGDEERPDRHDDRGRDNDRDKDPKETEEERRKKRRQRYWEEWRRLNKDRRRVWTPWLLIRYKTSDIGLRPIPSGEAAYLSPDIWVESSDPSGNAVAGEENFLHARVFNLGKATAAPTRVDFFWADPSLGLGAANMNLVGTEWVEVEAHTAKDVRCNTAWIPIFLNNGHECLKVNCTNPILDPITHPFQPRLDRHAGQRNITVLPGAAGEMLRMELAVNNLFALPALATIHARVEHVMVDRLALNQMKQLDVVNLVAAFGGPVTNTAAELQARYVRGAGDYARAQQLAKFLTGQPGPLPDVVHAVAAARGGACLNAAWSDHACIIKPGAGAGAAGNLMVAEDALTPAARAVEPGFLLQEAHLKAFEQKRLTIEIGVPSSAKVGEYLAVHVQQWTAGIMLGGYAIVVQVTGRGAARRDQ